MILANSSVKEILKKVAEHGADLQVKGDRLFLNAGEKALPAELFAAVRENKARIIEYVKIKNTIITDYPPLEPVDNKGDELPLSYSQERLWFLDELGLVGSAYNISDAVRMKGGLDIGALQKSFDALVERHSVLRTRFEKRHDSAVQCLEPAWSLDLKLIDLREEQDKESRVHILAREEAARPFNLSRGRLLRAALLQLAADEYVLLLTIHHIISDGWSMIVIIREINALYSLFAGHESAALPPLAFDYGDYVLWQRSWLTEEKIDSELAYWRQQLANAPDILSIPTDYPRPAVQSFEGRQHPFQLGTDLSGRINQLAKEEGVTPFMVLLATFKLFLLRWTGQEDMVVGTGIAGRTHHQFEDLIGFFVNTLVMRTDLSGDPSFRTLLHRVREVALSAYAHQHLPFEKIVAELSPERDLSRQPLVQVHIVLLNIPPAALELPHLTLTRIGSEMSTAKFDLSLFIRESAESGFLCEFEYATDLFQSATIARMAEQLTMLLRAVTAAPDETLLQLPFLTRQERDCQLQQWSGAAVPPQSELRCVHEAISRNTKMNGARTAIVDGDQCCSWLDLEHRSNQLAHFLCQAGVCTESLVAICLPGTIDFVVSLLAVSKAGGAYLPLDTRYPADRVCSILTEADARLVITTRQYQERMAQYNGALLLLDEQQALIERCELTPPPVTVSPDNLAYVIYTSGSTGKPKGVMLSHRGLSNLARYQSEAFHIDASSRVLQFASVAFDASVSEIFTTLYSGATLCLMGHEGFQSIDLLAKTLTEQQISVATLPPVLLSQLGDYAFPNLETLVIAGEACAPDVAVEWARRHRLVNAYGPSETTVCATWDEYDGSGRPPAIGAPLANLQVYLLNETLSLVPVGATGELYVGGVGVARGYYRQPGLTAERFIPSPFKPGERLYKTGDLARFLPDGRLDFLGRNDFQLKIRGYRIELGEIQAALLAQEGVAQAHLRVWRDADNEAKLLAYVVMDDDEANSSIYREAVDDSVSQWARLFDETGDSLSDAAMLAASSEEQEECRPGFAGWNSSFTGEAIPETEMQHWLDSTVARIRRYTPRRILEIGCGSGLILQHLLPDSEYYLGTDISVNTLAKLKKWAGQQGGYQQLSLYESQADALAELPPERFDTVILNSVIQYFPDGNYLLRVLEQALDRLLPGGRIFIGDVQHLRLNFVFHTAVQLCKCDDEWQAGDLRQAVERAVQESKELILDHRFFEWLPACFDRISAVEINLKRGCADNELVNYRYDVVLHTEPAAAVTPDVTLRWGDVAQPELSDLLRQQEIACVQLLDVPSQRLATYISSAEIVRQASTSVRFSALRPAFAAIRAEGEQPETYWQLAEQYGFDARIVWSSGDPSRFDVLFYRPCAQPVQLATARPAATRKALLACVNDPLNYRRRLQIASRLRERLQACLPDYMQPNALTVLDALPLTISGKIDDKGLPVAGFVGGGQTYVPPATTTEHVVVRYWSDILSLKKIGAQDNFFNLGGHSLLATRMITALQAHFSIELSLKDLFEYPSVAMLAAYIDNMQRSDAKALPPLLPQLRNQALPLSYAQERIWFLEQLGLSGPAYNIADAVELRGELHVDSLTHSFNQLLARHEILRARFGDRDGTAVQYVDRDGALTIDRIDLSGRDDLDDAADESIRLETLTSFDLKQDRPIRVKLFRLGPQRHILSIVMHHIISDGWSVSILIKEIGEFYRAHISGAAPNLPALPVQYVDYAIWQRTWLSGEALDTQLAFWKQHLAGASPCLDLPYDSPRPAVQRFYGDIVSLQPGKNLSDELNALASRYAATPFMVFMAAFNLLLAKWSGQRDIVIGTPVAGRTHQALEGLIGFFVNTVAMRSQIVGCEPFSALLKQVKETTLSAWAHQDLPFEKLVAEIQPQRDLARQPVFQHQLVFLNIPEQRLDLEGVKLTPASAGAATAKYDLTLYISESPSGFLCQFEYAEDLFNRATIERMAAQFEVLLRDICRHSERPTDQLQLLTEQERSQLLTVFNDTATTNNWLPLHQRLSLLAQQHAEEVAIIAGGEAYRWRELEIASNQLAHYLIARGVGAETVVGLCIDRSFEMVVAMLAIMKAGGAYLPLDPHYPGDRLAHMVRDSGTSLILAQREAYALISGYGGELIDIDLCRDEIGAQRQILPVTQVMPRHLAYMIYTSGSTGLPKGVMIEHGALMNFMHSMADTPGLHKEDTLLAVTPISFDISALEIFLPLLLCARLAIADRETATAGDALLASLRQLNVTVMQATPSTWRMLIEAGWENDESCKILCGGEALDSVLMRQLLERGEVWNLYGPTETTIWSTRRNLTAQDDRAWIGYPLANTQIYILDDALSPVPMGATGEMYIGGAGVARGYHQRPALTAERFIPSPFTPGERLYRTGDRVRMWKNKGLEYLGRADNQIKLNGYRIELGEIETVLQQQPEVEQAAVTASLRHEEGTERRLVAYLRPAVTTYSVERIQQQMQFSLHFFADAEKQETNEDIYSLYLAAAKRADELGFTAVWTPERHFTDIAAAFPNPATLCAALATVTQHIGLRAGSVVAPLHNPLRIAEEWAVVDQLSGGRAGVAFAPGWFADDFVLAPENFSDKRKQMQHSIDMVRRLWRGETVLMRNGEGREVPIRSLPRPRQQNVPVWITAASDPASFTEAGRQGDNVLTAMFGLTFDELAGNIARYREAREQAGLNREEGIVTVMLHTFVADSEQEARDIAAGPLAAYFRSHVTMREKILRNSPLAVTVDKRDIDKLIEVSVERFLQDSALIGSAESCLARVRKLSQIGVNEISCLIDFGIASPDVLQHLPNIIALRRQLMVYIDTDRLRNNLRTRLPDFMIPSEFVVMDAFPLTPNGKLDRKRLPQPNWGSAATDWVEPQSDTEVRLAAIWSDVLRLERIGVNDNFFALGGDSIQSIQIVSRARQSGIYFEARQLFEHQTIAQLVKVATGTVAEQQEIKPGPFPLLPIQQWFFEQQMVGESHFNLSLTLTCNRRLASSHLSAALTVLINHHDALRLKFIRQPDGWQQEYGALRREFTIDSQDLTALSAEQAELRIAEIGEHMQASLSLADDRLMAVALIDHGERQPQQLLWVAHHLLVDGISWRVLVEDLQRLYQQIEAGEAPALARKNLSLQGWGEKLQNYLHDLHSERERLWWRQLAAKAAEAHALPVDGQRSVNLAQESIMMTRRQAPALTEKLMRDLPRVFNTQANDVLLTALLRTFTRWTGDSRLLLHMEGHGREDLFSQTDVSRTVGWFTSLFPVLLEDDASSLTAPLSLLRSVKEQLRAMPSRGLGYGILRYLGKDELLRNMHSPEISFNYLGNLDAGQAEDGTFSLSMQSSGAQRDPHQQREHLIDISGAIINGSLEVYWTYNPSVHHEHTISRLASDYMQTLEMLVEQSCEHEAQYTPSDFPLLTWDQRELDAAFAHFGGHHAVEDAYPLSPMQQGILFHSLYADEPGAYYVTLSCTINGEVNQALFQQAWRETIAHHPVLRTAILGGEQPLQVVLREVSLSFRFMDWRQLSEQQQLIRLDELATEDRRQAVDFMQPSLMRIYLIKRAKDRYRLIWGSHLIILDGWSVPIVLGDVMRCYHNLLNQTPPLLEKAGSYRDYIAWLHRQHHADTESWWREQLKGFTTPTQLGRQLNYRSAQVGGQAGQEHYQCFDIAISTLEPFCQQHRITLNTLMQGVWAELLCRYTGRRDVLFGVTVSGRPAELPDIENTAGLFISTLPFRANFATDTPLTEWLLALQEMQTRLFERQCSSLVDIHSWSDVPDSQLLFESVLVYENYPTDKAAEASAQATLTLTEIDNIERNSFPLTLVFNAGEALSLKWVYDQRYFDSATIARLAEAFEYLLTQIICTSKQTLASLTLLDERMQRRLTRQFSTSSAPKSAAALAEPVHRAFEQQARCSPDRVATLFRDEVITYRQLNGKANQLARYLHGLKMGAGSRIGICMHNGSGMIAALLGVLKAGAAYIPLDCHHPQARINYLVEDADLALIITEVGSLERVKATGAPCFCPDEQQEVLAAYGIEDLDDSVAIGEEAYVIYTSGTTGRPKGVRIGHTALSNYVAHAVEHYLSPGESHRPFASYVFLPLTFDASVTAIYAPLVAGKAIFISDADEKQPLADLDRVEGGCEFLKLTPAHLRLLQARGGEWQIADRLVVGGEALTSSDLRHCGEVDVINEYGPTETTVGSTVYRITASKVVAKVPIGRPIGNVTHYVLNQTEGEFTLAPIGMAGELYIGGAGVALGYINNPALTAQRFITSPFNDNERLYRTGDSVCWREDGVLDYLGRVDRQIKLRGYRIELEELETVIAAIDGVCEVAVALRNPDSELAHLVAWVVMEKRPKSICVTTAWSEQLRLVAAQTLPSALIPSVWHLLPALPLTRNGKVDYTGLLAMAVEPQQQDVAPATEQELELASIWAEILEVTPGAESRFFDLGGNSLNAVRILAAVQRKYGVVMSVRILLDNPTLRHFAAQLEVPQSSGLSAPAAEMTGVTGII
ncbi:amino acid adenylation domain-containing protein [Pectobacteriaceae bacterium CE90]|nr:amino acid adenylation domain-containing protein [Pectobacteriaceae bacterium CE90]